MIPPLTPDRELDIQIHEALGHRVVQRDWPCYTDYECGELSPSPYQEGDPGAENPQYEPVSLGRETDPWPPELDVFKPVPCPPGLDAEDWAQFMAEKQRDVLHRSYVVIIPHYATDVSEALGALEEITTGRSYSISKAHDGTYTVFTYLPAPQNGITRGAHTFIGLAAGSLALAVCRCILNETGVISDPFAAFDTVAHYEDPHGSHPDPGPPAPVDPELLRRGDADPA